MAAISAAQKQWGSVRAHLKDALEQASYLSEEETGVIDREKLMAPPEEIARMLPDEPDLQ